MRRALPLGTAVLLALLLGGCASERYARPSEGTVQRGLASWYGTEFHGKATASGEVYDMYGVSAAHRELPLGTRIEVKNLDNGRSIKLRVNDRGPFVRGRVLDLSYGAARELDMVNAGVARVEIRVLEVGRGPSGPHRGTRYTVQDGAFRAPVNARAVEAKLAGLDGVVVLADEEWHRVRVGLFESREEAEKVLRQVRHKGLDAVIVAVE